MQRLTGIGCSVEGGSMLQAKPTCRACLT